MKKDAGSIKKKHFFVGATSRKINENETSGAEIALNFTGGEGALSHRDCNRANAFREGGR